MKKKTEDTIAECAVSILCALSACALLMLIIVAVVAWCS